jgi:hypothetical protein
MKTTKLFVPALLVASAPAFSAVHYVAGVGAGGTQTTTITNDCTGSGTTTIAVTCAPFERTVNKDAASGYAGLTAGSLLKTAEFPAFTGDFTTTAGSVNATAAGGIVKTVTLNLPSSLFLTPVNFSTSANTATGTASLASAPANTQFANATGSSAAPSYVTPSALWDSAFSSAQGSILYRGATAWVALPPGTSGQYLQTGGASANPSWQTVTTGATSLSTLNGGTAPASQTYTFGSDAVSGSAFTITGGTVDGVTEGQTTAVGAFTQLGTFVVNNSGTSSTNIASGTSGGTTNICSGSSAHTCNVGGGAASTLTIGSTNGASNTTINAGTGGVNINVSNNQATNINTGTSTGTVTIGNASAAASIAAPATFTVSAKVGSSGTPVTQIVYYSQTLTPASVAAATCAEQTFTVTGLATTDTVLVNASGLVGTTTMIGNARASATNTLAIEFCNVSAVTAQTPTSQTYTIRAERR